MARQSELDELRKEVEAMRRGQFADAAKAATTADVSQTFDEIHKSLADGNVQLHPPMSYQYETPAPEPETPAKTPRARKAPAKPAAKAKAAAKATAKRPPAKAAAPRKAPAKPRTRKITEPGA
jgi:sec-independent protein translocase protein TatB